MMQQEWSGLGSHHGSLDVLDLFVKLCHALLAVSLQLISLQRFSGVKDKHL